MLIATPAHCICEASSCRLMHARCQTWPLAASQHSGAQSPHGVSHLLDPVNNAVQGGFGLLLAGGRLQLPILLKCVGVVGVGVRKADAAELSNCCLDLAQRSCKCGPCCKQLLLHFAAHSPEVLAPHALRTSTHISGQLLLLSYRHNYASCPTPLLTCCRARTGSKATPQGTWPACIQ